ncbi:hypothetical protein [Paenibacillus xylanexedens]|uniref:hypothetical protein n=1 Tax=Paenibacillus xylanexedens TaxID=528191 RepID=UPI000F546920|nr:hypothetical protein [Paenibacillus xylanexedens]RPK20039.1 hypothetical protein EDO6_06556 [Paenibacillus xylanexedens]
MDLNILRHLKGLKTVSAIDALIAFLDMRDGQEEEVFEYPIGKLAEDIGISRNTAKFAVKELERLGIIEHVNSKSKNEQARFRIILECQNSAKQKTAKQKTAKQNIDMHEKPEKPDESYKKAVAGKKKSTDANPDIINNINNIDFKDINLYTKDINSMSTVNMNIYMTDRELGVLARRVMNEVFAPTLSTRGTSQFFAMQMRFMKDLLVAYRTEQVVAAIRYWTKINPPKNGVTSLKFLSWSKKGKDGTIKTNIMEALDYCKQQYLAIEHEMNREEVEQKRAEQLQREQEEKERLDKEKQEVEQMSSEDFVNGYMNRFSHLANKFKKVGDK